MVMLAIDTKESNRRGKPKEIRYMRIMVMVKAITTINTNRRMETNQMSIYQMKIMVLAIAIKAINTK